MIEFKKECVGCSDIFGTCLHSACPYSNVKYMYCDRCNNGTDKLYKFSPCDDEQLCKECLEEEMIQVFADLSFNDKIEHMKIEKNYVEVIE